jgi:hypothetical protein
MFLHLMALGTGGAIAFVPSREIGKYYFKFHATLVLIAVVAAVLLGKPWAAFTTGTPLSRVAAVVAFVFAAAVLVENMVIRASTDTVRKDALLFPVSIGVTFVVLSAVGGREGAPLSGLLLAAHFLSSAAVLGTCLTAMSTGHWYLSNAKLPFEILIGLTRGFLGSLVAKAIISGVYIALRFSDYRRLEDFDLLIMATRVVAGILMAAVLGMMALSCAKRKANQSATGILYVAVVFVLIGESFSMALTLGDHRPI